MIPQQLVYTLQIWKYPARQMLYVDTQAAGIAIGYCQILIKSMKLRIEDMMDNC